MPLYKITQQQGNRVITSTLEAKSVASVQAFLTAVSTAKIKYIYEVHYEDEESTPPIDDFQYFKQYKAIAKNKNRVAKQVLLHNLKLTMDEDRIKELIKTNLEVGGLKVDELLCTLYMK